MIRSERGQSLILFSLATSLMSVAAVLTILALNDNQLHSLARTKSTLEGYTVMQNFGVLVQRAYDLSQAALPGNCPSGTNPVVENGARFCLPPAPICMQGYCLSATYTASNETLGTYLEARLVPEHEPSFLSRLNMHSLLSLFDSRAHAQRVYQRPAAVAPGSTTNKIAKINCPGGALCKKCDNVSLSCLTLKVCPQGSGICTASQYWVQRYGIRVK